MAAFWMGIACLSRPLVHLAPQSLAPFLNPVGRHLGKRNRRLRKGAIPRWSGGFGVRGSRGPEGTLSQLLRTKAPLGREFLARAWVLEEIPYKTFAQAAF